MTAVEINQLAYARARFRRTGHESVEEPYALWGYATRPAGLNLISGCTFTPEDAREQIDHVLRHFQRWKQPANFFFGPSASPQDVSRILRKERRCMGPYYLAGMELDLRTWEPGKLREGVTAGQIDDWEEVIAQGHPTTLWYPKASRADYVAMIRELVENENAFCFISRVDGWIAGACLLYLHEGIAGIYDVVTKEDYRNRGAATAVVNTAHEFAREHNSKVAILQSHKKAAGLYDRLGYREIGTYTSMYYSRVRSAADAQANEMQTG